MYHEKSIYDDMEFEDSAFNAESSNSQSVEISGIDIYTVLVIGAIVIVITIAGTYYWTRKNYEDRSIQWIR
jgi:hypothetical protein